MRWKLHPDEVITYTTIMQEIDTANFKDFSMDVKGFFGKLSNLDGDSLLNKEIEAKKFLAHLNKYLNGSLVTYLTGNKKGLIDISVNYKQTDTAKDRKDTSIDNITKIMEMMTKNVQLRGMINDSGAIKSFYVKNDQRNLIALFFQLPGKEVKVGESWPLDVHFLSMDQNFKCDSSYRKNLVHLVGIKKMDGETIAVLNYDIVEYISGDYISPFQGTNKMTTMKMTFNALAEFSIDKGRWDSYDGIMSLVANGIMNSNTTKKFSLSAK
ncbi:MAG TPA: hypothetical protein VNZ45_13780 [Bacteroidia bacterium]|nr:hypothetical protein [Bacteroidia bacterium]